MVDQVFQAGLSYGAVMLAAAVLVSSAGSAAANAAASQCSGGNAIGITIDTSVSVRSEFATLVPQVVSFIDATSDVSSPAGANSNLYYTNLFSSDVTDATGGFESNAGGAASTSVEALVPVFRGTDIADGIADLTAMFQGLTAEAARIAIVFTDGQDASPLAEANALRAEGVTVAAVGIGSLRMDVLNDIASERADGSELVFTGSDFAQVSELFADAILSIDSDGDGVNDCEDGCPSDIAKSEPGLCGCGVPEGCDDVDKTEGPVMVEMPEVEGPDDLMPMMGTYGDDAN